MALTDINVCNRALLQIGAASIASLADDSVEANNCEVLYPDVKETAFSLFPWRFAVQQIDLGDPASPDPLDKWDHFWTIPSEVIRVNTVTHNGYPVKYEIFQDKIACNNTITDTLIMDAVTDMDEAEWPPYFTNYVVYFLASTLAGPLTANAEIMALTDQKSEMAYRRARYADSQQKTTSKVVTSRFLTRRY